MNRRTTSWLVAAMLFHLPAAMAQAQTDVNEETEKAMKLAAAKVSPSVVRIETSGGQDVILGAGIRKVVGPTTGLVVDRDGYILTSSFNFINKPTDIFVAVPGKGRSVAKVVATDKSRMLTLLKVDFKDLPVAEAMPKKEIDVGQWSLAMGRTLNPNVDQSPTISAGIISAVGRIWGKAVQTDAKVSPNNYGGPLVAIDGKVMGVLVPASPQSEGENAGVEWYDSGVGFAIPMDDINRILPKLKVGTAEKPVDLRGGLFGFPAPAPNQYLLPATIAAIIPESAAEKAGVKAGDVIIAVDGKPIRTMAQFLHVLKPLYEGDSFSMKVKRGDKEVDIAKVTLQGYQTAIDPGFLGILAMRDDPELGVEIRFVYPNSPASKAGLKEGDRIMKLAPALTPQMVAFAGRDQFMTLMSNFTAITDVKFEVKRKDGGKTETVTVRLGSFIEDVPEKLPLDSTKKHARVAPKKVDPKLPPKGKIDPKKVEPKKEDPKKDEGKKDEPVKAAPKKEEKIEKGLIQKTNPAQGRKYWVYIPRTYNPDIAHGLIVWLHPAGREGRDASDMVDIWEDFCEDYNLIIVGPITENKNGWVASETDGIIGDINEVTRQYTIDKARIVAHGAGVGGQMAFYLGFNAREQIRGVATVGAVLANQPKDLVAMQRLQFFIVSGEKDPLVKDIAGSKPKLAERKYNAILRIVTERGKEYLDQSPDTFKELLRWIDSLDRI